MTAPNAVSYKYGMPMRNQIFGLIAGGLMTILAIYGLVTKSPISIRRSSLDSDEAWIGWTVLLLGGLLILGLLAAYRWAGTNHQVVVGPGQLSAPPRDMTRKIVTINPRSITEIKLKRTMRLPQANIRHADGMIKLKGDFFESEDAFNHFVDTLERVRTL